MIFVQNNVNIANILIFMIIKKQNNKYIYNHSNKNTNETIYQELGIDNIKKLLPRCIDFNNSNNKTFIERYEKIHELDTSDIFIDL